jgi:glycosyltransferase involved in cell wall biosynthesis
VPAAQAEVPNNSPLVSIIVPARNEAAHIEACVRSLLGQDYPRFEVIVVDDCSEDGSGAILDRLGKEDPRLRVISGGGAPARLDGEGPCDRLGLPGLGGGLIQGGDTWHASLLLSGVIALLEHSDASFATVIGRQRHPGLGVYLANLGVFTYISLVTDPHHHQGMRTISPHRICCHVHIVLFPSGLSLVFMLWNAQPTNRGSLKRNDSVLSTPSA